MAGAAAGAGLIDAGNVSAGSAAASVGGAVFLTGSLYVAEQAVSDAVSGKLGDTEKYVRKALAGSVVGFLTGASGLMMQGQSWESSVAGIRGRLPGERCGTGTAERRRRDQLGAGDWGRDVLGGDGGAGVEEYR